MNYLLKILKISLKNIKQEGFRSMAAVLFVMVSVFFMNVSLSAFRHCIYLNTLVKTSGLYDSYMFAGIPSKAAYYESQDEDKFLMADNYVRDALGRAEKEGSISGYFPIYEINAAVDEKSGQRACFFFGDWELLKDLSFPVAKGEWFDTYSFGQGENDRIPVVVGSGLKSVYHVGQTVDVEGMDRECVCIGVLKPDALFINSGAAGSGIDLNSVTQPADDMVIVAGENEKYRSMSISYIIRLPDKGRDASEKAVLGEIADVVDTFSFRHLADEAYRSNLFVVQMQTTLSVLALLACIAGMGCQELLSFSRGKKRMAVYFLCGMDRGMGVRIKLCEGVLRLFLPAAAGFCLFLKYCGREDVNGLYVDFVNILFTAAVVLIIFAGTWIMTGNMAKRRDIIAVLKAL